MNKELVKEVKIILRKAGIKNEVYDFSESDDVGVNLLMENDTDEIVGDEINDRIAKILTAINADRSLIAKHNFEKDFDVFVRRRKTKKEVR